ncbi:hypothetical protein P154DRAFT_572222 [Amniculicola lignicola CBS 123094]|uniref:Uncharacterized protein n=1 Tax=Amniculicola lignicola CBS 123094 TaxID=1392246 RepID=A0A6A5X1L2_9PLEO|nr:hypothetical protein P154DRAFT_572222 [Amniculicola lignicola CBS 123094]
MPVAGLRGTDDRVEFVIVRQSGVEGVEHPDKRDYSLVPTGTVIDTIANLKRDDDDDDDNDFNPPPPILITMTIAQAQATSTGASALEAEEPSETVVVSLPPPPPPRHRGISQTTQHLLIAAGSIGVTIIIVMILLALHTMRKRGISLKEAVKHGRNQVLGRGPQPPPKSVESGWDKPKNGNDYGAMREETITPPPAAIARNGSTSSQRPLMGLDRSASFNNRSAPSPDVPQSFLLDSPPPRRNNSNRTHFRNISETPSSPILPLQNQRQSDTTRNTRSISDGASALHYSEQNRESEMSDLPPPPTFKQFLSNRPSASQKLGPNVSRFSWTNSQAPQTPHDPYRDTNSQIVGRDSFMTSRSSVPRFRTIDSWVGQQTNRLEEQKLREQLGSNSTRTSTTFTVAAEAPETERSVPEVPMLPKNVSALRDGTTNTVQASPERSPSTPRPMSPVNKGGLPGKNVRHARHDTVGTVDTAPIFKQHPGQEVRFSTRSLVPSEIFNSKATGDMLS